MSMSAFLSGLANLTGSLVGSGAAAVKFLKDDEASRYPPEYLMYKDMMKQMNKYPMNPMMTSSMYPSQMMFNMMNPMQMIQQQMLLQSLQQMLTPQVNMLNTIPSQGMTMQLNPMNLQLIVQKLVQDALQQNQMRRPTQQVVTVDPGANMWSTPITTPVVQSMQTVQYPPALMYNSIIPQPSQTVSIPVIPHIVHRVESQFAPNYNVNWHTPQVVNQQSAPIPTEPVQAVLCPDNTELNWGCDYPSNYIGNMR